MDTQPSTLHNLCRTEKCSITPSHSVSASFQCRKAVALSFGSVLHLNSREKGDISRVDLPSFRGRLHGSVAATLHNVAQHWPMPIDLQLLQRC